jgi:hypothetical protein
MTSIDDLKHDVRSVGDKQLGDLSAEERIRYFVKEAAEDREERLEWLTDTAPEYQYTATDLEYLDGIKQVGFLSMAARCELQQLYQAIDQHETTRDKYMALMLLNESLSRLSRGAFEIDEFGNFDVPDHDDAEYAYGKKRAPDTAYLATKYRELWEDVPAEFLVGEDDRAGTTEVFPNLAAAGSLAYPSDLSGEAYDDLDSDLVSSEVYLSELRLLNALVDFHTRFHGWRLFAEEYLDVTFDEFLHVATPPADDAPREAHGILEVDEQLCENILSLKSDYLEAYPSLVEEWAEDVDDAGEINTDLTARAQRYAEELGEKVELPLLKTEGGR